METALGKDQGELVAIGAAVASNCGPCLKYHIRKAREVGLTDDQLRAAVALAQKVKEMPARLVLEVAERDLGAADPSGVAGKAGCCG